MRNITAMKSDGEAPKSKDCIYIINIRAAQCTVYFPLLGGCYAYFAFINVLNHLQRCK